MMLIGLSLLLFNCGSNSNNNDETSQLSEQSGEQNTEDVVYENENIPQSEPKEKSDAPVFSSEYLSGLNKLVSAEKWISEEIPDNWFSIKLDENGFYKASGSVFQEDTYINSASNADKTDESYLLEFSNLKNSVIECYQFKFSDDRLEMTYFRHCAKGYDSEWFVNESSLKNMVAGIKEMTLKFTYVGVVSGDFYINMVNKKGENMGFSRIGIEGFDLSDNPYFEEDPNNESIMMQYRLKEEVKDKWLLISVGEEEMDIGNEEPEMTFFIKGIKDL